MKRQKNVKIELILYWPEWVESLEERLVRMTLRSPSSPSKRQIKTAAFLGLNFSGFWSIGVADSWNPTWETTLPPLSSMLCSTISSGKDSALYWRRCCANAKSLRDPPMLLALEEESMNLVMEEDALGDKDLVVGNVLRMEIMSCVTVKKTTNDPTRVNYKLL